MTDPMNPYLNQAPPSGGIGGKRGLFGELHDATSGLRGMLPQSPIGSALGLPGNQPQQPAQTMQQPMPPMQTGQNLLGQMNPANAGKFSDPMGGPPPGGDPLMSTHFPGGPPQAINPTQPGPVSAPAQVPSSPDPRQVLPTGPGVGPGAPVQKPQGFNPRQMIRATGQARGAQMERMARPTGARQGLAQAKATGNLPGGPPKPPAAY